MKTVYHAANTRGHADHGWLNSHHTFSFAHYHDPERMHFGLLRVLNDDHVTGGQGFGTHPHKDMEIISIPLEGDLEHRDSMGNTSVIRAGDIQVMSAGTGVYHSEYNPNTDRDVRFLQIWVFPREAGVTPRYDQRTLESDRLSNRLAQILSPNPEDEGVWIHQDAWFHLGRFSKDMPVTHTMHLPRNGAYLFVLEGEVALGAQRLTRRDGLGVWDTDAFELDVRAGTQLLLMEVPIR